MTPIKVENKKVYPVFIVETASHSECDFLVYVPDMDLYTEGKDFEDAIEMARDVIGLHGISLEDNSIEFPKTSTQTEALLKAKNNTEIFDYSLGILTFVDINFSEYRRKNDMKTVRRNVTLPSWLNYEADKAGINVSRVLQEALIQTLNVDKSKSI